MRACPFCGSYSILPCMVSGEYYHKCNDCGCTGPRAENMENSESRWNRTLTGKWVGEWA